MGKVKGMKTKQMLEWNEKRAWNDQCLCDHELSDHNICECPNCGSIHECLVEDCECEEFTQVTITIPVKKRGRKA